MGCVAPSRRTRPGRAAVLAVAVALAAGACTQERTAPPEPTTSQTPATTSPDGGDGHGEALHDWGHDTCDALEPLLVEATETTPEQDAAMLTRLATDLARIGPPPTHDEDPSDAAPRAELEGAWASFTDLAAALPEWILTEGAVPGNVEPADSDVLLDAISDDTLEAVLAEGGYECPDAMMAVVAIHAAVADTDPGTPPGPAAPEDGPTATAERPGGT